MTGPPINPPGESLLHDTERSISGTRFAVNRTGFAMIGNGFVSAMRRAVGKRSRRVAAVTVTLLSAVPAATEEPLAERLPPMIESAYPTVMADSLLLPPPNDPRSDRDEYRVSYDRGLLFDSAAGDEAPFSLRINLQSQFRYTGFARSESEWTDATGTTLPIATRNAFDINRGRVIFSGHALDPDLNYYLNLDYGSLGDDRVTILLAWLKYRLHRSFELHFGKGKVPGGREWLLTSMYSLSPDRSLATTFFRPSITTGVWATGEPREGLKYQAIVGNGFNTASAGFRDLDDNFVYGGNVWWEPWGEYGGLHSDLHPHTEPLIRLGASLTSSRQSGRQFDTSAPEETFIRLSDGTDLTEPGALGPGVSVTDYSILLATWDAGFKHRGWGITGEYFCRWLYDIRATGGLPDSRQGLFDHGFCLQGGRFVIPRQVELFSRTSHVFGEFGNGGEYAGGLNWYVRGSENWRFCFDVTHVVRSPAQQIRTGYDAGASGVLFRGQLQTIF